MWAASWAVAATLGLLLATLGCTRPIDADEPVRDRRPIVADDSVIHAFDTELEDRLIERIELDTFLRDREIYVEVIDGIVHITGEVWTPLERQRVGAIVRGVAGVVDVANELVVQPHD